jgi:DNA polymerase-3 subunit delta
LVSGDESLLVEESCDLIRKACRHQGFTERELFHIEGNNAPWDDVIAANDSMSLFADKKIIELRCKSNKIGDAGSKAILRYIEHINSDTILLMIMPKLDSAQTRSKWVKAIEDNGAHCQIWPIDRQHLPQWINQRLSQHGLQASNDAVVFLADNVEGNLLAAKQEIEKLVLLATGSHINLEQMTEFVSDSSRYTVFNYVDKILAGDAQSALKTLHGLKAEGLDTTLLVWAISRELRTLYRIAKASNDGMPIAQALRNERVFDSRKPLIDAALRRLNNRKIEMAMRQLRLIDQSSKGMNNASPWLQLEKLTLLVC